MVELEDLVPLGLDSNFALSIVTTGYPADDFLKLEIRLLECRLRD